MNFSSVLLVPFFAVTALAQGILVASPPAGAVLTPGSSVDVQVDRPNGLSPVQDAGLVIALRSCSNTAPGSCSPQESTLGTILYNGPFSPTYSSPPVAGENPHQTFTVNIPDSFPGGEALLVAVDFILLGAGPSPELVYANATVDIANSPSTPSRAFRL